MEEVHLGVLAEPITRTRKHRDCALVHVARPANSRPVADARNIED
jgi:hypothetical protein